MVQDLFPLPEPELRFHYPRDKPEVGLYLMKAYDQCGCVGFLNSFQYLSEAIDYAEQHCSLGIAIDYTPLQAKVIGLVLLEWNHENRHHATLHVYTWDNTVDWVKYFDEVVKPAIFETWLEKLVFYMPKELKAIRILAKRIGFTFTPVQYGEFKDTHLYGELTYGRRKTEAST